MLAMCVVFATQGRSQSVIRLQQGYFFLNHTHRTDTKPTKAGDILLFRVYTWLGDTLLSSTGDKLLQYTLPAAPPAEFTPLYEAFTRMHFSDSASVLQVIDSTFLSGFPAKWQRYQTLRHSLVLVGQAVVKQEKPKQSAPPSIPGAIVLDSNQVKKIESVQALLRKQIARHEARPNRDLTRLDIFLLKQGNGALLKKGEQIDFYYAGALRNGRVFDMSWENREPLTIQVGVGQMIAGLDQALLQLRHGSHACLFIPAEYAYGAQGLADRGIPPNTPLVFYVEIE